MLFVFFPLSLSLPLPPPSLPPSVRPSLILSIVDSLKALCKTLDGSTVKSRVQFLWLQRAVYIQLPALPSLTEGAFC